MTKVSFNYKNQHFFRHFHAVLKTGVVALLWSVLFGLSVSGTSAVYAQELETSVEMSTEKISNTSIDYLDNLPGQIENYINEHDWTDDEFNEYERIKSNITITLQNMDDNYNFDANIVISIKRPIYNTMQQTSVIVINDNNWSFQYSPNSTFTHDKRQYHGIASLLDFYAYIMLAIDYDTFSELGGTSYYQEAQSILEIARTANASGWSKNTGSGQNRYNLIDNLTSTTYEDFRRSLYQYYRLGLDQFTKEPEKARQNIITALENLQKVKRRSTDTYLFDLLFSAKYREFVSIFVDAEVEPRLEAYNLLSEMDRSHLSDYEKLQ